MKEKEIKPSKHAFDKRKERVPNSSKFTYFKDSKAGKSHFSIIKITEKIG